MHKLALAFALTLTACGPEMVDTIDADAFERGGKSCVSSLDCPSHKYCTTEDGDCFAAPGNPNGPSPAVCYGVCQTETDECGGCDDGTYCGECRTVDGSAFFCIPDGAAC